MRMKKCFLLSVLTALAVCRACFALEPSSQLDGDVLARFHFIGSGKIAVDPKGSNITAIATLPESKQLLDETLNKLSTAPFRFLRKKLSSGGTNNYAATIKSFLVDVVENESCLEFRGPTNGVPEMLLAVRLNQSRAEFWESSLSNIVSIWTALPAEKISGDGFSGWELKKHHSPNDIICVTSGGWLLFGWGDSTVRLQSVFLKRIQEHQSPMEPLQGIWLDAEVDLSTLVSNRKIKLPEWLPSDSPKLRLTVEGAGGYIRPELVLQYAQPLNLRLDDWLLPTNIVPKRILSFTVARGIEGWLKSVPAVQSLNLPVTPNQITLWGKSGTVFEFNWGMPMAEASNTLAVVHPAIISNLNSTILASASAPKAAWVSNQIALPDFPLLAFYMRAMRLPQSDFIFSGIFPMAFRPSASTVPEPMLHEIFTRTNLLAYDWEINDERMLQWRAIFGAYAIVQQNMGALPQFTGQKWIEAVHGKLGNCTTAATLSSPSQIRIVRNSMVGLTGVEINLLEHWLDSPQFPFGIGFGHLPMGNGRNRPPQLAPPGMPPVIPTLPATAPAVPPTH